LGPGRPIGLAGTDDNRTTIWSLIALNCPFESGLPAAAGSFNGEPIMHPYSGSPSSLLPHGSISCTGKTDAFVERTTVVLIPWLFNGTSNV